MRRKLALVAVLALLLAGALYAFGRGYTYGAASAIYDQAHGRSRLFLLGCTYWPRTPYEERRGELLSMNYHLSFDVIGGIAPSDYAVQFQAANNLITWGTLRLRFGPGFLEKIEAQAHREARDVRRPNG